MFYRAISDLYGGLVRKGLTLMESPLGKAVPRLEDARLLRGEGRYTADFAHADALQAWFVRADVAMAQVKRVDTLKAETSPGVRLVLSCQDERIQELKRFPSLGEMPNQITISRPAMVAGEVRHVGEILAVVVAETLDQARNAAEQIEIEFHSATVGKDPSTTFEQAYDWRHGDREGVDKAMCAATHRVRVDTPSQRVVVHPMETRAAVATYDRAADSYALWTSSQGAHKVRDTLCEVLGLNPPQLRVITPDVGGAFGIKLQAYPEQALVLMASHLCGRPVRWVAERTEGSITDAHGRAQDLSVELALDDEGRFTALRVDNRADIGAYATGFSVFTPATSGTKVLGHAYRIPAIDVRVRASYSEKVPVDAYRGAGKPEMVYLLERAINEAARVSGIDRVALRQRNLVPREAMPHPLPMGRSIDDADFHGIISQVQHVADWAGFRARREAAEARGFLAGIGIGLHMHVSGGFTNEHSRIAVGADGSVIVDTGAQDGGQGHATVLAQIVAARLELPVERIEIRQGDTSRLTDGGGTGGSSSLPIAGANLHRAAGELLDCARQRAADQFEAALADVSYAAGELRIVGTDRRMLLFDLAEPDEPFAHGCDFAGDNATFPNGAYVAEVEIDPETGVLRLVRFSGVDDIGTVVNPLIAMGQIHGGIVQGLGQAMMEEAQYDESGQLLNASLMDYALPRADDLVALDCEFHPVPTTRNPLGAKGVGELGPAGALAPLVLAALDALKPLGVTELDMPLTSERIWRAIRAVR